jgi:hypothetical protein
MFDCDYCDKPVPMQDRYVAATPRPSDPTELVAVLWTCGPCGRAGKLTSPQEIEAISDGITGEGPVVAGYEAIRWISV